MRRFYIAMAFALISVLAFAGVRYNFPDGDWKPVRIKTGASPKHLNVTPVRDKSQNNFLSITTTAGTEVMVKLMKMQGNDFSETDTCYRAVYVSSGDEYKIRHIPAGKYYLKVAYGRGFSQCTVDGKTVFGFASYPLFEIMPNVFDFTPTIFRDENDSSVITGYSFPTQSVTLHLDVQDEAPADASLQKKSKQSIAQMAISEADFMR